MTSAIILCGGKNSRLSNYKKKIIKPLIKFKGKTLLEHHLEKLKKLNFNEIFINTFKNKNFFLKLKNKNNLNFNIINEIKNTGTAGVVVSNIQKFDETILVLYGDNYLNMDIIKFYKYFEKNKLSLLMGVFKKKDLSMSGSVKFNIYNTILDFKEKDQKYKDKTGYCNAGIYLFKKNFLKNYKKNKFLDFAHDIFSKKIFDKNCKIYKIKSCKAFDTLELYSKNLTITL